MKAGIVAIVGRPNTGKSTLVNALLKQKVAITSPKPQTTRFPIQAVYEDSRGQIIFVDTPGIFGRTPDVLSKKINPSAEEVLSGNVDLLIYLVDHTRERDFEENKTLGIVRKALIPKILVINKMDVEKPSHIAQYRFMQDEFDTTIEISALKEKNLKNLVDAIFEKLPERQAIIDTTSMVQPSLTFDSKTYIAEIIREKAFLNLRDEVPYTTTAVVDSVTERENGTLYIRARLLTTEDKYKGMIVGKGGSMIREISMAARKELEIAGNRKVFLELTVEVDPHWMGEY